MRPLISWRNFDTGMTGGMTDLMCAQIQIIKDNQTGKSKGYGTLVEVRLGKAVMNERYICQMVGV